MILNGTGTVTINNANTFSGGIVANAGTLKIGNASALGTGSSSTSASGACAPSHAARRSRPKRSGRCPTVGLRWAEAGLERHGYGSAR